MKAFVLGFTALLALSACSNMSKKKAPAPGMDSDLLTEWSKPFVYENVSKERRPSSDQTSPPRTVWEADTLKIPVTAGAVIDQTYNVKFTQALYYETVVRGTKPEAYDDIAWRTGKYDVLICPETAGSGKSEYWNSFFSAPKESKAARLADAIDGIGNNRDSANGSTASNLIRAGYFHEKPRSWTAFEDEIQRASQAGIISKQIEYMVIYKFRKENMQKLGYDTQTSGICWLEPRTYAYPEAVVRYRDVPTETIVPHRDVLNVENRQYPIRIAGSRLQSFESEMVIFSFNHDTNQVSVAEAAYTNYSVSIQGTKIFVQGTTRKDIKLPSEVLPAGATLEASQGMARFSAPIGRQFIPKANEGVLRISMQITSCKRGTFGGCAVFKKDERSEPVVVDTVTSQLVRHEFPIINGRKYWVRYWVNMPGSPWYSNNVVKAPSSPEL